MYGGQRGHLWVQEYVVHGTLPWLRQQLHVWWLLHFCGDAQCRLQDCLVSSLRRHDCRERMSIYLPVYLHTSLIYVHIYHGFPQN